MTPNEVEALFQDGKQFETEEDGQIILHESEKTRRIGQLKQVLSTAEQLLVTGNEELNILAQKIGDGSRNASWRIPLGESGLLEFFIELVGNQSSRPELKTHTLRIIGNSCADTDENRARVVSADCLPRIVSLIKDDSLLQFAITVLFNICVDYEPAQVAAYKSGLNPELINLISSPRIATAEAVLNIIFKLLGLIASQEPETDLVHPETPSVLLKLAMSSESSDDVEDFLSPISVALTCLSNPQFQQFFLQTSQAVPLFLQVFAKASETFDVIEGEENEATQLKNVQSVFTQVLADLSANPLFDANCSIGSPGAQTLQQWIQSPYIQLQSAACLALGNIARSDEACISLVQKHDIHKSLIAVLADPSNTDAPLLHSVLGFLKNLAIPVSNKPILGDAGLLDNNILPRIWGLDTQIQVQFDAISLSRLLLVNCPPNVQRLCAPLSNDDSAHERTHLYTLISLFLRSDQEPTKTEAARAVAAVIRVLHSSSDASTLLPNPSGSSQPSPRPDSPTFRYQPSPGFSGPSSPLKEFYATHDTLPNALLYLGTQSKFPVLRSELWFAMALMSRSPEGASVAATCLQKDQLLRSLLETVGAEDALEVLQSGGVDVPSQAVFGDAAGSSRETGVSGLGLEPQQVDPGKKTGMERVDRENGLVLIAELLQRCPEKLRVLPLHTFKEILQTGGQMVMDDRVSTNLSNK